ncbi:Subtilase family protein [Amycolatopsis arida]|uniref:Subtilase family protein n=1 Tax=Amycolatopsis arida TaxID=587909 RepID=A0A1I5US67_9PSEU|nr:subtilase family protein [Amycolatopsis arida]SFP98050.1 Subtilase family protein [Amycolatopsis arida]
MSVRRTSAMLTCAALLVAGQLVAASPVLGAQADGCGDSGGAPLRYLVVFDRGTAESAATSEILAACGAPTIYYPEIAVAVATSADRDFADRLSTGRAFSAQRERLRSGTGAPRERLDRLGAAAVPTADRTAEQWNMRAINAELARAVDRGSRDVVVGVLDSGIDPDHPDLAAALAPDLSAGCLTGAPDRDRAAWEPTTSPHGTHVAGTIAAADDGRGVTGVAPGVRLASVKVVDDHGRVDPEAVVCGFLWAARNGLAVTNSSYAVDSWSPSCGEGGGHAVAREAVTRAVAHADAAGTLNVAAATNTATNLTPVPRAVARSAGGGGTPGGHCAALPAGLREVVTVSAVTERGVKAGYSSYGLGAIDLAAPGGDAGRCVLSTVPGGYASLCGTSMAAPHVAGVAALLASTRPHHAPRRLRQALAAGALPVPCPADYDLTGNGTQDAYCAGYTAYNGFYGHGLVDALAAVSPAQPARPVPVR